MKMPKKYKKYYLVTIKDIMTIRELASDLPFAVIEGKMILKQRHPDASQIKHISSKEVQKLSLLLKKE